MSDYENAVEDNINMIDYEISLLKKKRKVSLELSDNEDGQQINPDFKIFKQRSYICEENSFVNSPDLNERKKKKKKMLSKNSKFSLSRANNYGNGERKTY